MKKIILTSLLATAFTTTAFAAPAPVTTMEKGASHIQLDAALGQKVSIKGKNDTVKMDGKNHFGFAVDTTLTDNFAIQYGYTPVKGTKSFSVTEPSGNQTDAAHGTMKMDLHQIQGIYKLNDNLNLYAGLDFAKFKQEVKYTRTFKKPVPHQKDTTIVETNNKSKTGVVLGLTGHHKLNDKLTAFASVGAGTITRYDAKFGLTYAVTKDVDFTAAYGMAKYKIAENGSHDNYLKNRGVNLAINYKF